MQEDAHLARLLRGVALPLALLPLRTRTTVANAGRIDHTQAPISLSTPLLRSERPACWTPQRPIGLERKVLPREATHFPGRRRGRWTISRRRRGRSWTRGSLLTLRWEGRSKFGDAHRVRMKLLPQFEADIPDPLRHDLPALLSPGRVRTPSIRVDLLVFI